MENYPNFNQIINNKDIFNYIMINANHQTAHYIGNLWNTKQSLLYLISDMINHANYTM